jgi:hypothetical protein
VCVMACAHVSTERMKYTTGFTAFNGLDCDQCHARRNFHANGKAKAHSAAITQKPCGPSFE